jgi:hypothetical protein
MAGPRPVPDLDPDEDREECHVDRPRMEHGSDMTFELK